MSRSLLDHITQNIHDHDLIDPGVIVVAAVSGGADSVCLLHLLSQLPSVRTGGGLVVAHLDHGLRQDSAEDACFVEKMAADLRLPYFQERIDVSELAQDQKWGIEEAGREARRQFLERIADLYKRAVIALAHHRDDQAETVLMHLSRGCGVSGLKGMTWKTGRFIRPLLSVSREEIHQFLTTHQIVWREDDSNKDERFYRNLIRHQVLPALHQYNQQTGRHIAELADRVACEESFWEESVAQWFALYATEQEQEWRIDYGALMQCHRALKRRLLRELLTKVRGSLRGVEAVHVQAVETQLVSNSPQWQLDLPSCWVARRYGDVIARHCAPQPAAAISMLVPGPGRYVVDAQRVLVVECREEFEDSQASVWFPEQQLHFPLLLRSFKPGDRICVPELAGHKKLKALFAEHHWSHEQRQAAVVLECCGRILWVPGVRQYRVKVKKMSSQRGFSLRIESLQK
nr:tRNA lysidine(34) synthetase TilS [uncultured Desulfuromonas sp.]